MEHSPAEIVAQLLLDLGLANADWPAGVDQEPSLPDSFITVKDTTPVKRARTMVDGEVTYGYGVQIRVRSTTHRIGYPKAAAISTALDTQVKRNAVAVGDNTYTVHCATKTEVIPLYKDTPSTKRHVFTMNPILSITEN